MMGLWLVAYNISTPGESQSMSIPTDNRNTRISNIEINSFLNNQISQFYANRQNTIDKLDKDISHLEENTCNNIINGDTLTFATHNIRGVNNNTDPIKFSQIIEHFSHNNIDFVSLTETHHKSNILYKHKQNQYYTSFWSQPDPTQPFAGVALLVSKKWDKHIVSSFTSDPRLLYVDLFLKGHVKLRIISCYIHASIRDPKCKHDRRLLQKQLLNLLDDCHKQNYNVILMGDLNTNINDYHECLKLNKNLGWRFDLIEDLSHRNYMDLQLYSNEEILPTFIPPHSSIRNYTPTRLDGIFSSPGFFTDLIYCGVSKPLIYQSDHKIVTSFFINPIKKQEAHARRKKTKRKKFVFSTMTQQHRNLFAEVTDVQFKKHKMDKLLSLPVSYNNMNHIWEQLRNAIITAANKSIPHKWIFADQNTLKPRDLVTCYDYMKQINKIVLKFRASRGNSRTWPIGEEWITDLKTFDEISRKAKLPTFSLPTVLTESNVKDARKTILTCYHNLKALFRVEEANISQQRIKHFISQRCLQYESNPGKMIESALGRSKKTITLDRLVVKDADGQHTLINDPHLIKQQ